MLGSSLWPSNALANFFSPLNSFKLLLRIGLNPKPTLNSASDDINVKSSTVRVRLLSDAAEELSESFSDFGIPPSHPVRHVILGFAVFLEVSTRLPLELN